ELASVAQKLGAGGKRGLPMLDQVRVASPCNASWDEMLGDQRVRFCLSCEKNVYNLSAMPREEAETFLQERVGQEVCVRFYRRADGTLLTEDCPVGVKKKRRKKLALAVAGAGAMAFAATSMLARGVCVTQGAMPVPAQADPEPPPPVPVVGEWEMGDSTAPPTPQVMGTATVTPPPRPAVTGRRVVR
ncbi:MAG: hypothetical protein K0S65_2594, partial [Labilithrix sp.]|nr:hypothetical protein [Labilithrix sp.]